MLLHEERKYRSRSAYPEQVQAYTNLSSPGSTAGGAGQSLYRVSPPSPSAAGVPSYDEKKHCCLYCNKRFNRPSSLNIHIHTHTGAKPFQCFFPGCQRRFNVNSNMRRHWRNH
ncbi:hypothetical protein BDW22DRAFT_1340359, partial [Trametopsis cervina]